MSAGSEYRFVRPIATGGMGRIDLVVRREGTFARAYARKRILRGVANDGAVRAMLREEARVAGLVRHANVVPVIDLGEDDEGPFLVMELIDGVSLLALIERLGDRIPVQVCVEIARQIAEGIHAAHELPMEVVHRDLTPSNVIVGFDGVVRVTDFGVAKARDRVSTTRAGAPKGKRSYMAPEQIREEDVDRRTDLFALGVVLAEMLKGGPLHGDASAQEITRRTLEEPPPDPGEERADLPPDLVALCFELMARAPSDRPRDARAVAQRLASIHAALRAEEGPIDLGELVRARFDDARRAHARVLADALRDEDPTRAEIALPPPAPLRAPRAAPSLAAVGAIASVIALVLAAAALWIVTHPGEERPGAGTGTTAVPVAGPVPVADPRPEPGPNPGLDPDPDPDPGPGPGPVPASRRTKRSRPPPPDPDREIPTWGWQ